MRGMGSLQSHLWHKQPGMRNETDAAALAAAATLVIRRSSDQILQSRCKSLVGGAQKIVHLKNTRKPQDGNVNSPNLLSGRLAQAYYQEAVSLGEF
jgi:hypothetical protein